VITRWRNDEGAALAQFEGLGADQGQLVVVAYETGLARPGLAIADWCNLLGRGLGARLVTAVGNLPQKFGYPAAVEGAVIVEALDWSGSVAPYSTAAPVGAATWQASGGQNALGQTLGTVTVNGTTTDLVGTSFAAALITAELAR